MIKELGKNKARLIVSVTTNGHRHRYTKTVTYNGKRELKKLYDDFEHEVSKEPCTDVTVKELLENHLAHCRTMKLKATTMRGYGLCAKRLYSPLDGILAKNLTTYQVEKIIAEMSDSGLAAKTIKNTISFLSSAYDHAIYTKLLEANPCRHVTLPKGNAREVRILYKDEIQDFLYMIANAPIDDKVAYELALFSGLRRSEILGLKESDVDLMKGVMYIHTTRHRVNDEDIEQDTKTKRSTRTLAVPEILIHDIAALLEVHSKLKYKTTDYLIQDGFGGMLNPATLSNRLTKMEDKYNMPHVTLHGLRHTYASLLNASGIDMARISAELGHSNLTTTMNIYTHIFNDVSESSRGIAEAINSFNALTLGSANALLKAVDTDGHIQGTQTNKKPLETLEFQEV